MSVFGRFVDMLKKIFSILPDQKSNSPLDGKATINFVRHRAEFSSQAVWFPETSIQRRILRLLELDYGWRQNCEGEMLVKSVKEAMRMCVSRFHKKQLTTQINLTFESKEERDEFAKKKMEQLAMKLKIIDDMVV